MAIHLSTGSAGVGAERHSATIQDIGARADVVAPLIAGARARGIADAFEMMGEAVILLDFTGTVLHVAENARPLLGCAIGVAGGHVVATDRKSRPQVHRLLESGLAENGPAKLEEDVLCVDGMRQRVRLYRVPAAGEACQLLAAVLVLEPPRRVRRRAIHSRSVPHAA